MPIEKVIAKAKISKSHPLNFATKEVLNPTIKHTPNTTSNMVDAHPRKGINEGGTIGFKNWVYSRNLLQLPQAETS